MRQLEQCCPPSAEKQRRFPIDLPADRGWSENAAARVRVAIRDSFPKLGDVSARYWRTASFHILLRFRRAFYCSCVWLHWSFALSCITRLWHTFSFCGLRRCMRFWFSQTSRFSKTSDERISDRALVQRRDGRDLSHCGGQGPLGGCWTSCPWRFFFGVFLPPFFLFLF